jgi:hypothetical protein
MSRIEHATPESQIAVWRLHDGSLKSNFAATIKMQRRLEMRPPSLIGVFDQTSNKHDVLAAMGYTTAKRARAARKGYDRKRCGVDVPMLKDMA